MWHKCSFIADDTDVVVGNSYYMYILYVCVVISIDSEAAQRGRV